MRERERLVLIVQRVAQDEDVRHKEDGQLDRHAAGVEWAFFGTAQKHDIGQRCAGGVAVVGEQDDLGTVLPGQMQRVHHIPRCAGVGDKDHDVLGPIRLAAMACMWLSPAVRNLVESIENRAQMSQASI